MEMADGNIFFSTRDILAYGAQTNILVFTANSEKMYARRLLHKGVRGFIGKSASVEELGNAIRLFLRNEIYVSAYLTDRSE